MAAEVNARVVVYQEGSQWIAQCVDFDIAAQADTMNGALRRFDMAYVAHMAHCEEIGKNFDAEVGPAPKQFETIWGTSEMSVTPKTPLRAQVSVALCEAA